MMDWMNQDFGADHVWFRLGGNRNTRFCLSSKSSSATDEATTSTTGAASPLTTGAQATNVGAGSIGVGSGGRYQEEGSADLTGSTGANIGGVDVTGNNTITVSDPSTELAQDSLKSLSLALTNAQQQISNQSQSLTNALNNTSPASTSTGSLTLWDRFTAWLEGFGFEPWQIAVLTFAFVGGVWFIFHRRKNK